MGLELLLENPELASRVELKVNGSELIGFFEKIKSLANKKQPEPPPRYIRRDDAKQKLGIKSDATIISWEKKGILRSFRVGRSIFYLEDQVNSVGAEILR